MSKTLYFGDIHNQLKMKQSKVMICANIPDYYDEEDDYDDFCY